MKIVTRLHYVNSFITLHLLKELCAEKSRSYEESQGVVKSNNTFLCELVLFIIFPPDNL
jgi:hypothetical protein